MTALMPQFHIARPRDVEAAVAARREHPGSRLLAGGTDLVVNMRHGIASPTLLIDLAEIGELAGIEATDAGVRIGASVTVAALPRSPILAERYRALAEAAEAIAGPGHRAMATVGGNLCLDTRCIFYNQSEWWRHANSYCLKHGGEVCHVAPQGQRCHAAFTGDLAPACWHSEPRSKSPGRSNAGAFRSANSMSRTAKRISRSVPTKSSSPCTCRRTRRRRLTPNCACAARSTIRSPAWRWRSRPRTAW